MSDNVHMGESYACYIFTFSLSVSFTPPTSVQVCNVNIKTSTFFFLNVVDNQSQAGSSPAGSESPAGGHTNKNTLLFASTGSLIKLGGFVYPYVRSCSSLHTHFSTTLKTQTPRAFDPSAFFFFSKVRMPTLRK